LERQAILLAEERTDYEKNLPGRVTSPFLKLLLTVSILLVLITAIFHVRVLPEIIGFTGLVLVFWLLTEAAGWKSDGAPHDFPSTGKWTANVSARQMFLNLPGTCGVFHDINTGHAKIDHVILSREHGLFVIEVKDHPGKVSCANAQLLINNLPPKQDFFVKILWNSLWLMERARTATKLEVTVTPIIVFSNATVDMAETVNGVVITTPDRLPENILNTKIDPDISASLWKIHESGALPW